MAHDVRTFTSGTQRGAKLIHSEADSVFDVAPDSSSGMGGFLQGMLGDLLKMVKTDAPIQWEMAQQFGQSVATDGDVDVNPDPIDRIHLEQLLKIAELHVADISGMTVNPDGATISIDTMGRGEWARRSLENWRPIIEKIAVALKPADPVEQLPEATNELDEVNEERALEEMITKWATAISPTMLSMQIGSVVGHLARRVLSQYELLLPRTERNVIALVPANVRAFADAWSIPYDDLALWLVARDVTITSILARPHITARLTDLLVRHADGFRTDPTALQDIFSGMSGDMSDLGDISKMLGDPAALQAITETPETAAVNRELAALAAAIDGYAEWVTMSVVARISGSSSLIKEALRRYRVEQVEEARTVDHLFGLSADQHGLDRGESFIKGVIERDGEHELSRLWVVESDLPTPAEVDAPGLWLERVNLPKG